MDTGSEFPPTLPTLFSRTLRGRSDRTALISSRETLSYEALDRRSNALANALVDAGIEPGDRVATALSNRLETPVVDIAIYKAGGARLPINPSLSTREITHMLTDSAADAIFCEPPLVPDINEVTTDNSLRCVADAAGPPDGWHTLADLEQRGESGMAPAVTVDPDSIGGHFYTGGTTGEPKGVLYSQSCLSANLIAHLAQLGFSESDTGLVSTPLSHSGGTFLQSGLLAGGTVCVQRGFDVEQLVEVVTNHDVTWTFLVPTMLYRLLDAGVTGDDVPSLERILYGAAPMQSDRLREAIDRFGPIFVQFYGQTEVPNLITTLDRRDHARAVENGDDRLLRSAGRPCPFVDIRIVDPTTGKEQPAGKRGEITVSSPYSFDRYHGRPDETEQVLRDGWVHTGDIGKLDADGYLYLLDRLHNVIVTGGLNVYSSDVETVLGDHPAVADVAVIGVPHEEWGEAVHALVVTHDGESIDESALLEFADDRLAGYKKPKSLEFVDELPTTPLGKLDKQSIRDRYWDDRDRRIG
ncbi:AMP-binding protein [Halobacteria archaeon AArc-curdl1]|uniref:AMP-binding protein n=1 Tax=Natronosalvus hydrolyticus TaxID=2979988 RepID=A0AAP2ZC05_9EURY|nr:AMP-binding protein [Halobacteria archaeon AArc-curdl1]